MTNPLNPNTEAELIRLKFHLELVRTIAPIIMIAIQVMLIAKIF